MNSIQEYRDKAAQARQLAVFVADTVVREQLEIAAKDYDDMADQLEASPARQIGGADGADPSEPR